MLREEWRVDLRAAEADVVAAGRGGQLPAGEAALVRAAAALGAGEPRRATRILDAGSVVPADESDLALVGRALRALAGVLDEDWFPGGAAAARESGRDDGGPVAALGPGRAVDPEARHLVAAARFLTSLPAWRFVVTAGPGPAGVALAQAEQARAGLDEPAWLLAAADLAARSGVDAEATLATAKAAYLALGDPVGAAGCSLLAGDRCAAAGSHPEVLGEFIGIARAAAATAVTAVTADVDAALSHWLEAERAYATAGAERGTAAVALRRAAVAVEPSAAVELLDRAVALATGAGDGALAQLAVVHRALAHIRSGARPDVDGVGAAVAAWAATDGSRSFARGLARLSVARAARWRDDDVVCARLAHRLAEAITLPLGAPAEAAVLRDDQIARYGAVNHRRAAFVLADAEITQARRRGGSRDGLEWGRLVSDVAALEVDAQRLGDGQAVGRVAEHVQWLLATPPAGPMAELAGDAMVPDLAAMLAEQGFTGPLYRAVALREAGEPDDRATVLFEEALTAAARAGTVPTVVVLSRMRRVVDALAALDAAHDDLPLEVLVRLWVGLGRAGLARDALAAAPDADLGGDAARPWLARGLRAEILLGTDDPHGAADLAGTAIDEFEEYLGRLSLDVFRTSACDDPAVARLYTTAVRARARLVPADSADPADPDLARGFELSDRCRGGSLTDLLGRPQREDADPRIRRWQQAGALLARTVERVADQVGTPWAAARVQEEVRDAERTLDEAEAALATASPDELAARRVLPASPPLASVRDRLAAGTLLLQFHAFDDELVTWGVTRDTTRVVRQAAPTSLLCAEVRGWHRLLARASSTEADREQAAERLSALLLRPWGDELEAHERVVVVPHGPLSVLPFHALPWGDDVLGAGWTVSSLPAASVLAAAPDRPPRVAASDDVLVVGDPSFAPSRGLRRLPGTRAEARAVASLRASRPLLDADAAHDQVLERLASANVVHLATHGLLAEGAPYSAELALAGSASLTVPDLVGARTSLDLAVLSACDSGRGRATAAGDVIGLTRALLAAGARELVVSLWPVDDQLTCLMMVALHEELTANASVGVALRRAGARLRGLTREEATARYRELDPGAPDSTVLRTTRDLPADGSTRPPDPAHPSAWAPFVHIGHP